MTQPQSMTLGGEGGNSFPFDAVGDFVKGKVRTVEQQQQTDMESGEPAFWPGGKPKLMYAVTMQTELRDDAADDGMRCVFLKGSTKPESKSSLAAVRGAVKGATGAYDLQYDGELTLQFSNVEPPATRGFSPRKLYDAWYVPPVMTIGESAPGPTPPPAAAPAAPPAQPPAGVPSVAPGATATPPAPSSPPAAVPPASPAPAAGHPAATPPAAVSEEQRVALIEATLTDAQKVDPAVRAALGLPAIAVAAAWDSDPRVAALRAMNIADDAIRTTLGI